MLCCKVPIMIYYLIHHRLCVQLKSPSSIASMSKRNFNRVHINNLCCLGALLLLFMQVPLYADSFTLNLGDMGGTLIGRMIQLSALMALLTLAPSIIVVLTSFTRIVVVFSFLRNAIGTQQSPPI